MEKPGGHSLLFFSGVPLHQEPYRFHTATDWVGKYDPGESSQKAHLPKDTGHTYTHSAFPVIKEIFWHPSALSHFAYFSINKPGQERQSHTWTVLSKGTQWLLMAHLPPEVTRVTLLPSCPFNSWPSPCPLKVFRTPFSHQVSSGSPPPPPWQHLLHPLADSLLTWLQM